MSRLTLTDGKLATITQALRVAASVYDDDARMAAGDFEKLAAQFSAQAVAARELADSIDAADSIVVVQS